MLIYYILFISQSTLHSGLGVQISHWVLTIRGRSIDEVAESLWASRGPDRWSVFAHTANSSQPTLIIILWRVCWHHQCVSFQLCEKAKQWTGFNPEGWRPSLSPELLCWAAVPPQQECRHADDGKWANSQLPPITIPLNIKPSAANHGVGHLNPVNQTKYYYNPPWTATTWILPQFYDILK